MGELPTSRNSPLDMSSLNQPTLTFSAMGARPKRAQYDDTVNSQPSMGTRGARADIGDIPPAPENMADWSVVFDWCRGNREENEQ